MTNQNDQDREPETTQHKAKWAQTRKIDQPPQKFENQEVRGKFFKKWNYIEHIWGPKNPLLQFYFTGATGRDLAKKVL